MPARRPNKRQDLSLCTFYDDFGGSLYDNVCWAVRGSGGSIALQTDGSVRVRATANANYEFYQKDLPDFRVDKNATLICRYRISNTANMQGEVGFEAAAPDNTTNWITLYYDSAVGPNWQAQTAVGGVSTTVDTGVTANASFHEFEIRCTSAVITYFLDGALVATITTNIPTMLLQVYSYVVSKTSAARDVFFDWVEATGERE
jgi:hypothetical protein